MGIMSGTKSTHTNRKSAAQPTASRTGHRKNLRQPHVQDPAVAGTDTEHRALPGLDVFIIRCANDVATGSGAAASTPTGGASYLVSLQVEGRALVRQDERQAELGRGDFTLCDGTRPYELELEAPFEQIVFKLPVNALRSSVRDVGRLTASAVTNEHMEGQLLIEMVRTLWRDYDTLEPAARLAVANGIVNLLVAGLHLLVPPDPSASSDSSFVHLERIKRLVDSQLSDPELGVTSIARQLGLSTGHLHRVFKSEAVPLAHYIWLRRLEACSRDLLDPRLSSRSIGEIAYRRGFKDAAHFSRSFKERFGVSPRDWRGTYGPH